MHEEINHFGWWWWWRSVNATRHRVQRSAIFPLPNVLPSKAKATRRRPGILVWLTALRPLSRRISLSDPAGADIIFLNQKGMKRKKKKNKRRSLYCRQQKVSQLPCYCLCPPTTMLYIYITEKHWPRAYTTFWSRLTGESREINDRWKYKLWKCSSRSHFFFFFALRISCC